MSGICNEAIGKSHEPKGIANKKPYG